MSSDKCSQYQQDYDKLLELKQEFDVALAGPAFTDSSSAARNERDKQLAEAKLVRGKMESILNDLEFDLRFKNRMKIVIGTGLETVDDFERALAGNRCEISNDAKLMMENQNFTVVKEKKELELVIVSLSDLGFSKRANIREIHERIQELGLDFCPPEVGPQLRLQYKDQPKNESLLIAMELIVGPRLDHGVFSVAHDNHNLWLRMSFGHEWYSWPIADSWVFARRRQ